MAKSLSLLIAFGLAQISLGDKCCSCITGGGGMACASRCGSQSSACQTCVSNGGGSGCINDGRCSCSSPSPSPSPSPSGYNPTAAVNWADQNCAVSDGTECAEFVSNALRKAGESCFHTYVPDLDSCLKGHGWAQGSFPGRKGAVVIWYDSQGPYHAALSRGDGTIDQHNPSRCGTSGSWGDNYVLNPPGTEVKASSGSTVENLSASQIAALWKGSNCATAVAVALAESSGNCNAHHTNDGGTIDRGLWQVNDYWHPECSDSCAYDCSCNAGCAKSISSGGSDWTPWATYNAGAHLKYMSQAQAACGGQDVSVTAAAIHPYPRSMAEAAEFAKTYYENQMSVDVGLCDHFVAVWYGLAHSGFADATAHWKAIPASDKLAGWQPGALAFWSGGSHGHVAIGDVKLGRVYSTDYPKKGFVGHKEVGDISSAWGFQFLGWTKPFFNTGDDATLV